MGEVKVKLVKVSLSSGKAVYLREMKISDTEKSAQKVSRRCDGDPLMMQVMIKKALLQSLLVKIAVAADATPRDVTPIEKEDLDSLFTMSEYGQVMQVVGKLAGDGDKVEDPKIEFLEG